MSPTAMIPTATSAADLRRAIADRAHPHALVPTMGALHDGHAELIRAARAQVGPTGTVVVSVFVNPTQFGPGEDFDRYPRSLDADVERAAAAGADVVFAPTVREVYGPDPADPAAVTVDPGPLGQILEGAARPGHFRGVLTVVAKLFGLVAPDVAVFGEKDYQQLVLIRRMVADLAVAARIVAVPTVREADGLALSSRNRFLSTTERDDARALSAALAAVADALAADGLAADALAADGLAADALAADGLAADALAADRLAADALAAGRAVLAAHPALDVDYLVLTAPDLGPAPRSGPARVLVAARVGSTRLIDNRAVTL